MKYLIANWKAELNSSQITEWLTTFTTLVNNDGALLNAIHSEAIKLVICPPYPYLHHVKDAIKSLPQAAMGAQSVSPKAAGKYTGEVTAEMLKHFVQYVIIGHSERRNYNGETEEMIAEELKRSYEQYLHPLLCIRGAEDTLHEHVKLIAYEPVAAIGSGQNADLASVLEMKKQLTLPTEAAFIYGGSVDAANAKMYLNSGEIDGFLVGSASTKAETFYELAKQLL
ncbi:MAG: triose-phosphate isomerase [Weeksellaceae bacterium]